MVKRRGDAERAKHLFVVRIWRETSARAPAQWRGSVEHVPGESHFYFTELRDLSRYIARRIGDAHGVDESGDG